MEHAICFSQFGLFFATLRTQFAVQDCLKQQRRYIEVYNKKPREKESPQKDDLSL